MATSNLVLAFLALGAVALAYGFEWLLAAKKAGQPHEHR
jgi:hypothetical protein